LIEADIATLKHGMLLGSVRSAMMGWSTCWQRSRRGSLLLRKERWKPWKSDGASSRRNWPNLN